MQCEHCKKEKSAIPLRGKSKGLCKPCYKKFIWKPQLSICKRCNRLLHVHARGLCNGCYVSTFHMDKVRFFNAKKRYGIDEATYQLLKIKCVICGFDKIVEIHHLDHNKSNSSRDNLASLCPNHHKMLHSKKHQKEVVDALVEKGYKAPQSNLSDGFFKRPFRDS